MAVGMWCAVNGNWGTTDIQAVREDLAGQEKSSCKREHVHTVFFSLLQVGGRDCSSNIRQLLLLTSTKEQTTTTGNMETMHRLYHLYTDKVMFHKLHSSRHQQTESINGGELYDKKQ